MWIAKRDYTLAQSLKKGKKSRCSDLLAGYVADNETVESGRWSGHFLLCSNFLPFAADLRFPSWTKALACYQHHHLHNKLTDLAKAFQRMQQNHFLQLSEVAIGLSMDQPCEKQPLHLQRAENSATVCPEERLQKERKWERKWVFNIILLFIRK